MITIILIVISALTIFTFILAYICYRMAFYSNRREIPAEEFPTPQGEIYEPFRARMVDLMKETRTIPHNAMEITSFDGLRLRGKYYEYKKGAPVELMFHGYRGSSERDLCGGVQRCFRLGRNVLLVDQRGSGESEGKVITFGIKESRDVLSWIECIQKEISPNAQIVLTGISMGAATVLTAAGRELPENVICILADCSYSSAKDIIKKVIADRGLPPKLLYPFMKLGARVYGKFRINETSPLEAMKRCKVPVILIHGEDDDYVPCEMSHRIFDACKTAKVLFTVPGAGHGLSYLVDTEGYFRTLEAFCKANKIGC